MAPRAQLIIVLEQDGKINVNGPIGDKLLCYGMLECAKSAIKDYVPPQGGGLVVPHMNFSVKPPANGN